MRLSCSLDSGAFAACADPVAYSGLGQGVHAFQVYATDPDGNRGATVSTSWRVDTLPPTAAMTSPTTAFTLSRSLAVTWTGADSGSGLQSFDLRYRRAAYSAGFGATVYPHLWQGLHVRSLTMTNLLPGYDYCVAVRAHDKSGNVSGWSRPRCIAVALDDRTLSVTTSGWTRHNSGLYYLGTYSTTTHPGATLARSSAYLDRIGLVATKCPTCGTVGIYVNDGLFRTISLAAPRAQRMQLIQLPPFSLRIATVTIRVLSTGKPVCIDGLALTRT
jgi:hypothetical protein